MWAKISTSATAMACAACLATAATLPAMGTAGEQLASTLGAVPLYAAFLADPTATTLGALLDGVDATSATSLYTDFLADPSATTLGALFDGVGASTLGAVPIYLNALSDPSALTDIAAFSALGAPVIGTAAFEAVPNIVNSLAGDLSRASALSGIDAFNALPVYNAVLLNGDISALAPDQSEDSVGGIAAFSAVPGYLGIDPPEVARLLMVVENDGLVQLPQVRAHANTSLTRWRPATRASISSRVL